MKRVAKTAALCAGLMGASLLLARVHPFGDAGLYAAAGKQRARIESSSLPAGVRSLLEDKCADCHSNQARAPLYGRFAPVSWMMERDVIVGRAHMNLSLWDSYSAEKQQVLEAEILQQTKTQRMPLPQYRWIHPQSRMADADIAAVASWTQGMNPAGAVPVSGVSGRGDAVRGRDVFERRCVGCHSLDSDREGPRLRGVFGRTSGSVRGFPYSAAMAKAGIAWDEASLEKWLADPDALVPGNNMEFHVANAQERRDLIQFLRSGGAQMAGALPHADGRELYAGKHGTMGR